MNDSPHLRRTRMRFCLAVIVFGGSLAVTFAANAQAPVITVPRDLNVVGTNEAFGSGAWTTKTSMPTARDAFAISQINGKIYVAGGELFNNNSPIDTFEVYDVASDAWSTLAPMPTHRWFAGAGTANGIIYVVGGQASDSGALHTVEAYDPSTDTWSTAANMPTARHSVGIAVVHDANLNRDILYAIGGATNTGSVNVPVKTVEAFDPVTNTWTTKTSMLQERWQPVVGVVNGKIYAIGGFDTTFSEASDKTVEAFDPVTNTWTMKTSMPTARGAHPAGGVANNIIYVAGGIDQINVDVETSLTTVEAYDPTSDTWSAAPDMLSGRTTLGGAVVNNILYAVGGFQVGAATVGQPFIYQITATNHPTSYSASGLPAGLSIDTATGIISGVPTTAVDSTLTLTATNADGTGSALTRLTVHAAPPSGPLIISSSSATGRTGQPFSFRVVTKHASRAARFTAGGLPYRDGVGSELTIDPVAGLISGTPTSDGNFGVALTVTDGSAKTHATLQLTFISDPTVPVVTSSSDAFLTPGTFFKRRLKADVAGQFTYIGTDGLKHGPSATCEGLPPGLCFDGVATISGTYNPISVAAPAGSNMTPDTITIRPRGFCQPTATNIDGTGTAPLNFFER